MCLCVCVYKSRLSFGFVYKLRFNFRFVSVQTCLFVCLCIYNQCDLSVCMLVNWSLVFDLYLQTKVTLLVVNVYTRVRIQVCACTNQVSTLDWYVYKPWTVCLSDWHMLGFTVVYVFVCLCIYKSRLRFGFVCQLRFNFRFVSAETCLFVCLCIYNQCDLFVCTFINWSLFFDLHVQTKVTLLIVNVYTRNCVVSIPLCTLIKFYYLSRLYTTYSNSCKLLQLVNYATCFDFSAIIRLTHKYDEIKV